MVTNAKEIARLSQEMVSCCLLHSLKASFLMNNNILLLITLLTFQIVKSSTDSSQLGPLAAKLAHQFSNLAGDTRGAVASTSNLEVSICFM